MYILGVKNKRVDIDVTEKSDELKSLNKSKKFNYLYFFPIFIGLVAIALLIIIIVGASRK